MIYYLHEDAAECAQMLDDKTLNKQIKAIAQTLCDIHYDSALTKIGDYLVTCDSYIKKIPLKFSKQPWPKVHSLNEFSEWGSKCLANYKKLVEMGLACCEEYCYRFNKNPGYSHKEHDLLNVITWARDTMPDLPYHTGYHHHYNYTPIVTTPFPLVMSKEHIAREFDYERRAYDHFDYEKYLIMSYRNYYRAQAKPDAIWTRRKKPTWITFNL